MSKTVHFNYLTSLLFLVTLSLLWSCNREGNKTSDISKEEFIEYFGEVSDSSWQYQKGQILFEEGAPVKNPFQDRIHSEAKHHFDQGDYMEEYTDSQLLFIKANGDTIQLEDYMLKIQAIYDCDAAVIIKFESNWNGSINYAEILDIAGPEQSCLEQLNLVNHIQRYRFKTKRFNLPSSQTWTIPIKLRRGKTK